MILPEFSKVEVLRLLHLFSCFFLAVFLLITWKKSRKIFEDKYQEKSNDIGLLLIAGAYVMWIFMDSYRFLGTMKPGESSLVIKTFSSYNNAFFLAAIPYFDFDGKLERLKNVVFKNKLKWVILVLVSNIFLVMLYSITWKNGNEESLVVETIDTVYSIFTYVVLGLFLVIRSYFSFNKTKGLFVVTFVCCLCLLFVQLAFSPIFEIEHYDVIMVIALVSQFVLGLIFILLGYETSLKWIADEFQRNKLLHAMVVQLEQENKTLLTQIGGVSNELEKQKRLELLSARELDILGIIHLSYTQIGEQLFISRDTVISHKKNIEGKLRINGKAELELFAKNNNLSKL
jgi:DNA-binding CsgD family transcriptional regulator